MDEIAEGDVVEAGAEDDADEGRVDNVRQVGRCLYLSLQRNQTLSYPLHLSSLLSCSFYLGLQSCHCAFQHGGDTLTGMLSGGSSLAGPFAWAFCVGGSAGG